MPPKSFYPRHGSLNSIEKPVVSPRVDLRDKNVVNVYKKMVEAVYIPNAILGTGPYKGIVLRVERQPQEPEAGSWVSDFFGTFYGKDKKPKLVQIKARIPELHSMLPVPETLGDESEEQNIIEMYPTFIAQAEDVPAPSVGALVWLDFGNKTNFTDPIYIKPVVGGSAAPGGVGKVSGKNAHKEVCAGKFSSEPPQGDVLAGKNKPFSHIGLPLQPRKPSNVVSEEFIFLKGTRFSQLKFKKWEKAIRGNGVPGKTWLGLVYNNGAEDPENSSGKRDTLIFVPNTTDLVAQLELIYFFHDINEFGDNYDFDKRYSVAVKLLSESNRNFVLVVPELPWSIESKKKNRDAWIEKDNFADFHSEILSILKQSYSKKINIGLITVIGYGEGGRAVKTAAIKGFEVVKPQRIIFADASYGDYVDVVWNAYVKQNLAVEFNLLTQADGATFVKAKNLYDKIFANKNVLFQGIKGKNHKQIGDVALTFLSPSLQKAQEDQELDLLDQAKIDGQVDPNEQEPITEGMVIGKKDKRIEQPEAKLPLPLNANVSASAIAKSKDIKKTSAIVKESVVFEEARICVSDYGSLSGNENILVPYQCSVSGKNATVHKLVAKRLDALNSAWISENSGAVPIKIHNGFRQQKFSSDADYEKLLLDKYGSINEGKKWVAKNSPHETGLAVDVGNNGLEPRSKTNDLQKQTKLYRWLKDNAHKFGFTPYKLEAWHWECRLPKESWASGEEFTDNLAVRVEKPGESNRFPAGGGIGRDCVTALKDVVQSGKGVDTAKLGAVSAGSLQEDKKKSLISQLARQVGIEPEVALAFARVESGGALDRGSYKDGKVIIRFEDNHMFALLSNPKRKNEVEKYGVSLTDFPFYSLNRKEMEEKWWDLGRQIGWSKSSRSNINNEYAMLNYIKKINEQFAYDTVSSGMFQVMGANCNALGYESPKQMYESFSASEEMQIRGFFTFIVKAKRGCIDALKNKDFYTAAGLYNGKSSSQQPVYAQKLEGAYNYYKTQGIA